MIGGSSFRNDKGRSSGWLLFSMTSPLPHFGSGGDLPLIITKNNNIFLSSKQMDFRLKIRGIKQGRIIEPEFLKDEHFRITKSFQKPSEIFSYRSELHFLRHLIDRSLKWVNHMWTSFFYSAISFLGGMNPFLTPYEPCFKYKTTIINPNGEAFLKTIL